MRQRLLLVAGWAAAAAIAGLVASGAVAVAGGEVLDRPLRPLTAAEVAALPVAATDFVPQGTSPLPPAASLQSRDGPVEGADRDVEPGIGSTPSPVGDRGADAPSVLDQLTENAERAETEASPPRDLIDVPPRPQTATEHMVGGSVSIAANDGRLLLLWAKPNPGFTMSLTVESEQLMGIVFTSGEARSVFVAEIRADGTLETERTDGSP